ncbi:lysophospholipid acyltransferase family protein [Kaarinaea lacus]
MNTQFVTAMLLILTPLFFVLLWRTLQFLKSQKTADWGSETLNVIAGLNRVLCYRYHRLSGDEIKLPDEGGAIVVSNHLSGLDALLLVAASNRPLRFIIAKEQYQRFGVHWLVRSIGCIPVERQARPQRAFRAALRMLAQGEVVALFPHGTIHLDSDPPRRLKAGVVKLAKLSGCPIYPVRLDGITGQGHTILSIPLRSHAVMKIGPPIDATGMDEAHCLQTIADHIEKPGISES